MNLTLDEFKYLTSVCWNEKNQPFTNDMAKIKYTSRSRLGLKSLVILVSSPFLIS